MANDDRNRPQNQPTPRAPSPMEPIKVASLRTLGGGVVLPPPATGGMLVAKTLPTGEVITIQYEPWQRHHRVLKLDSAGKVVLEVCIPEAWVAYTPDVGPT